MAKEGCFEYDPSKDGVKEAPGPSKQAVIYKLAARSEFLARGTDSSAESTIERFIRLQQQTRQLQTELEGLTTQEAHGGPPLHEQEVTPVVASDVRELNNRLGALLRDPAVGVHLEQRSTGGSVVGLLGSSDENSNTIIQQAATAVAGAQAKGVTYEMYATPSQASPLLDLDRKLSQLEKLVYPPSIAAAVSKGAATVSFSGGGAEKGSGAGNESDGGGSGAANASQSVSSLFASLTLLQRKLDLLSDHRLDVVYRRTKTLLTDMDTVEMASHGTHRDNNRRASAIVKDFGGVLKGRRGEQQDSMSGDDKQKQMLALRELMEQHTHTAQSLPSLTQRLKSQADYHQAAGECCQRLQALEKQQVAVHQILNCDRANLAKAQVDLSSAASALSSNFDSLLARLAKLK